MNENFINKDQKIILFNGRLCSMEDIKLDDVLMGPDGLKRKVVHKAKNFGRLYKVIPQNKYKDFGYFADEDQILFLRKEGKHSNDVLEDPRNNDFMETVEISVKDYLKLEPWPKRQLQIYKTYIDFPLRDITFKPYDVNRGINLYQDLSKVVNNVFGHEVVYYSVQPQGRGKDVVIKEYTLFDVVDEQCVKVMVPNNQFPDAAINFDSWGLNFQQPFEIHIDRKYFESIFGKGSQPRKRDIIYFPLTNRIYEINSTYLFRDFMYSPVYFKIELKKYSQKSNTYFRDPAYKEELDGIAEGISLFRKAP